ncbi:MAG: RNA polymerase sigma factor [Aureispira sp.]|nr:RNA polymerase sigma factor [Aureispira sp.]
MGLFWKTYKTYTDEQLMVALGKGKKQALDELYERYSQKMYRYFYRMLAQNRTKSEDFVQDLFLKLIEKPYLFNPKYKFVSWLYSIASNMCKNEYRRHQYEWSVDSFVELSEFVQLPNTLDQKLFREYLTKALATLKPQHQECFTLRYEQGLSIAEISEIMEIPEGTVKSRIFYTLKKLAEHLKIFNPSLSP